MKAIHGIIAAAALTFVQPAPASAAPTDPEVIIYRFPGVLDDGGAFNVGIATVFHCTNFSGAVETMRFVTRNPLGQLLSNFQTSFDHLQTIALSTHQTNA